MEAVEQVLATGSSLVLREAGPEDAAALIAFVKAVAAETDFISFQPEEFDGSVETHLPVLESARGSETAIHLIALVDGKISGSLSFTPRDRVRIRHWGEFGMSVKQEFWGLGIGGKLLDTFLSWARQSTVIQKINLRVRTDNARARRLYESRGFELEGTIRGDFQIDGILYDHHCMGIFC